MQRKSLVFKASNYTLQYSTAIANKQSHMVILRVRRFAHRSLFPHTSAMLFPETTICVRITFFTTRNGIIVMERLYCPTHYTGPPAPSIIQIRILGFDTWRLTVISSWIRQVRCEEHPHLELEKKSAQFDGNRVWDSFFT